MGARSNSLGTWQVRLALDPDEEDAIRQAMLIIAPMERWTLVRPDEDDEDLTITLNIDVRAKRHADAEQEAIDLYGKARAFCGLPRQSPLIIGVRSPIFGPRSPPSAPRRSSQADNHIAI
jgi:hypothetical protein